MFQTTTAPSVRVLFAAVALSLAGLSSVQAQATPATGTQAVAANAGAADVFIKSITADLIDTVRSDKAVQAGDLRKAIAVVEAKVLPHVNFKRMTAMAMAQNWRKATPAQRERLQKEFRDLLVYTYAGALSQIKDEKVEFLPLRARPEATDVIVRSQVRGKGEPVQIEYRVEKSNGAWKVYDVNVLGAWLVESYKSTFTQEISASGIDGLISKLAERNKQLAAKNGSGA